MAFIYFCYVILYRVLNAEVQVPVNFWQFEKWNCLSVRVRPVYDKWTESKHTLQALLGSRPHAEENK